MSTHKDPILGRLLGAAAGTHAGGVRGRHPPTAHNAVEVPTVLCVIEGDHLHHTYEVRSYGSLLMSRLTALQCSAQTAQTGTRHKLGPMQLLMWATLWAAG